MENYIAFVTLSTGGKHKITENQYNQFLEASNDDFLEVDKFTIFKKSAVMNIQDIRDWTDEVKTNFDYHQPYEQLPAAGYAGIINHAKRLKDLEALGNGVKKAIAKIQSKGQATKKAEALLEKVRQRYVLIKG